jgi:hypothetical protein
VHDAVLALGDVFAMVPGTEPEGLPTTFAVASGVAVLGVVCGTILTLWRTGDAARRARNRSWARILFACAAFALVVGLGAFMRYANEHSVA